MHANDSMQSMPFGNQLSQGSWRSSHQPLPLSQALVKRPALPPLAIQHDEEQLGAFHLWRRSSLCCKPHHFWLIWRAVARFRFVAKIPPRMPQNSSCLARLRRCEALVHRQRCCKRALVGRELMRSKQRPHSTQILMVGHCRWQVLHIQKTNRPSAARAPEQCYSYKTENFQKELSIAAPHFLVCEPLLVPRTLHCIFTTLVTLRLFAHSLDVGLSWFLMDAFESKAD